MLASTVARQKSWRFVLLSAVLGILLPSQSAAEECSGGSFESTFALIQKAVFENRGCTFHIEHIVAKQHGGSDAPSNLALACHRRGPAR